MRTLIILRLQEMLRYFFISIFIVTFISKLTKQLSSIKVDGKRHGALRRPFNYTVKVLNGTIDV